MMSRSETRRVIDEFLEGLNRFARGEAGDTDSEDAFAGLHADVSFSIVGQMPWAGTHRGIPGIMRAFAPTQGRMAGHPHFGVFPTEFIEDGDRMVVLAKGRGGSVLGEPYNSTYFLFFEVRDGKVLRFVENADPCLSWRCVLDTHLEPEA